ncbi:MAG: zeta toxin family protein [Burkholderiales bacterium]
MASSKDRLSDAEIDRIYAREIRDAYLGGVERASAPTVVFVGGTPGSGKTNVMREVNAKLAASAGEGVIVSGDDMREFHPGWRREARHDAQAALRFNPDASRWVARLYRDAIAEGKNVVLETSFRSFELLKATAAAFRAAGYLVEATVVAAEADKTRRAVVGRFLDMQARGDPPRFVTAAVHDEAYRGLRATLKAVEQTGLVDRVRVVTRDGQELYANAQEAGKWRKPAAALEALDSERERRLTPTELAQNAVAWHALVARAQLNPNTPREVLDQAVAWRKDASHRALADPEAAKQYQRALAGEAFRTLPRDQFLREFPTYAGAVERLEQAARHASKHIASVQDQQAFLDQTRARLAEYIAEGRQFGRVKTEEPRSR